MTISVFIGKQEREVSESDMYLIDKSIHFLSQEFNKSSVFRGDRSQEPSGDDHDLLDIASVTGRCVGSDHRDDNLEDDQTGYSVGARGRRHSPALVFWSSGRCPSIYHTFPIRDINGPS